MKIRVHESARSQSLECASERVKIEFRRNQIGSLIVMGPGPASYIVCSAAVAMYSKFARNGMTVVAGTGIRRPTDIRVSFGAHTKVLLR